MRYALTVFLIFIKLLQIIILALNLLKDLNPKAILLITFIKLLLPSIKPYDYTNPNDLIYINIWMEELIPGYKMDINTLNNVWFDSVTYLKYYTKSWKAMNQKLNNNEISLNDYIEWKLNIDVFELEKNRYDISLNNKELSR